MKKVSFFISFLTIALIAISCSKNEAIEIPEGSFLATIDGPQQQNAPKNELHPYTKIEKLSSDVYWESDDKITINGFVYNTSVSGTTVVFDPVDKFATGGLYYAFHPEGIQDGAEKKGHFPSAVYVDPTEYQNSYYSPNVFYLYGETNTNIIQFCSLVGYLKFSMFKADAESSRNATSIKVTTTGGNLWGDFSIQSYAAGKITRYKAIMSKEQTDDTYKSLLIYPPGAAGGPGGKSQFEVGDVIYVPIPAGSYNSLNVELFNESTKVGSISTTNTITILPNKYYTLEKPS